VARYRPARINKLLRNPEIIRNRLKIESAVSNARSFLDIQERTGSFSQYVWQFTDHQPRQNCFRSMEQVPATTSASDRMSKVMKKDGFKYVGSTICYAYMQATGMVNDHLVSCFRYEQCRRLST
jgi:DNA-3-methyladenine glycosylase I